MSRNEVLKMFEEIGYEVKVNISSFVILKKKGSYKTLHIMMDSKMYKCHHYLDNYLGLAINFQENELINKLFKAK